MKAKTIEPISYQTALQRAAALCAGSEHCCYDISEKLKKWSVSKSDTERIIDYLIEEKYIDEKRFSTAYAKDKMRYNKWGRSKIDQGLRLLRIDAPLRRQALNSLPEDEYIQVLSNLLLSKSHSVSAPNTYQRNMKLVRFALGRGFEMDLIRTCLPPSDEEDDADFDMEDIDLIPDED